MKHHRLVSRMPQKSQSNFQAKVDFIVGLTARVIEFSFAKG